MTGRRSPMLLVALVLMVAGAVRADILQLGVGMNYYRSVEDTVGDDLDRDGVGYALSTRLFPTSPVHLGFDIEKFPNDYAGLSDDMYAPSAYLVIGRVLYAALGVGMYYYDGTLYSDEFYTLRAGLTAEILPRIYLDLNGNYRFEDIGNIRDEFENIDTDTVTLGGALRIAF